MGREEEKTKEEREKGSIYIGGIEDGKFRQS